MNEERPVMVPRHSEKKSGMMARMPKGMSKMSNKQMMIAAAVLAVVVIGVIALVVMNMMNNKPKNPALVEFEKNLPAQKSAVDKNPNDAGARFNYGSSLYALKKNGEAIEQLEKATQLDGKSVQTWNSLGNAYRDAKRFDDAAKAYGKAIEVDAKSKNAYVNLANMQMGEMKDTKGAVVTYDKMMKAFEGDTTVMMLKAGALQMDGQKDAAKELYNQILAKDPNNASAKAAVAELK